MFCGLVLSCIDVALDYLLRLWLTESNIRWTDDGSMMLPCREGCQHACLNLGIQVIDRLLGSIVTHPIQGFI